MRRISVIVVLAVVLLARWPPSALAYSTGISGFSGKLSVICSACHGGGRSVPTVFFSGPTGLDAGATGSFTFTVHSNAARFQTAAGFDVAASGGTLTNGPGQQLLDGELTHTAPQKNNASGEAVFGFQWTAPLTPDTYTLWGAGNSVNQDGTNSGDRPNAATFLIAVRAPASATPSATSSTTPTPTVTATPVVAASPTASIAASPTPPATLNPTPSVTQTPVFTAVPTDPPTATRTPTASPMPTRSAARGDANCDRKVNAADLTGLALILGGAPSDCGADANADGIVDAADIAATLVLVFEP